MSDSWKLPSLVAPSPKKDTATRPSPSRFFWSAAPVASGIPPPTMPLAPRNPSSASIMCKDPPFARLYPSARAYNSAYIRAGSAPRASMCPWPRWVLVITSPVSRAAHTPTATASWPT